MTPKSKNSFEQFMDEVSVLLEESAEEKGYNNTGTDGKNELYQFVQTVSDGDSHALGEIIYKVVRYQNKQDKKELTKIAAWAYLIWKFGK